jgi:hypothetical protein
LRENENFDAYQFDFLLLMKFPERELEFEVPEIPIEEECMDRLVKTGQRLDFARLLKIDLANACSQTRWRVDVLVSGLRSGLD